MKHDPFRLKKVCSNCPFRSDREFHGLREERVRALGQALKDGAIFHCHKTVKYDEDEETGKETHNLEKSQFCAGALATIIKGGHANMTVQVGERLGLRDPDEFDHEAQPTYDSLDEWVEVMVERDR